MIKIENVVLPSAEQWKAIIRGMRNPMNSWDKSDSYETKIEDGETLETADYEFFVGDNDLSLMDRLTKAGSAHAKFKRMIWVYADITAPMYWWKEWDTYLHTVRNSCSTMHKIQAKEFTHDDFSMEHMMYESKVSLNYAINALNYYRYKFIDTKDKDYWWQMIQLLPSSYNQRSTVMMNYETLSAMYRWRKDHKLDEWRQFCDWIKTLPYNSLITGTNDVIGRDDDEDDLK